MPGLPLPPACITASGFSLDSELCSALCSDQRAQPPSGTSSDPFCDQPQPQILEPEEAHSPGCPGVANSNKALHLHHAKPRQRCPPPPPPPHRPLPCPQPNPADSLVGEAFLLQDVCLPPQAVRVPGSDCDPLCLESPPPGQPSHLRAASSGMKKQSGGQTPGVPEQKGTVDSTKAPADPAVAW